MVDHAPLIPSFRDFSSYAATSLTVPESELPKPTVLEVASILAESTAGKLGEAVSLSGWPWLERMEFLEAAIPGIKVHSLGGIAPFQADGIWGPYEWYYRERSGYSHLRLAPLATFPSAQESLYDASGETIEFRSSDGWVPRFLELWERLERSPFLYEFPSREVDIESTESGPVAVATDRLSVQPGWGFSPTDAWLDAANYSTYLDENLGWSQEFQEKRRELMEISREPSNRDERVYALDDPDFTVDWDALRIPEDLKRFVGLDPTDS